MKEEEQKKKPLLLLGEKSVLELQKLQMGVAPLFLLENIYLENKIEGDFGAHYQTLIRKGYIDEDKKITQIGRDLYESIEAGEEIKEKITKAKNKVEEDFKKWWCSFPSTDGFTHNGVTFPRSRGLRTSEKKCWDYFEKLVKSGKYTSEEIMKATAMDIKMKMDTSVRTRENKMTYLRNSATYLNNADFDPFVEIIRKGEAINNTNTPSSKQENTVDI